MSPSARVDGVTVRFLRRGVPPALADVSLEVCPGEIVGVIGSAGSGKTVLLRVLAGEVRPTCGRATVLERPAHTPGARAVVGFAADPFLAPPELSGIEWLQYVASHRADSGARRLALVRRAVEYGALGAYAHRRVGRYTSGMAKRLALATAALCGPTMVLLDDVLAGLDPAARRGACDVIAGLALSGRAVVIASHDLATVERVAGRVVILRGGHVAGDVPTAQFLRNRVVDLALHGGALQHVEGLVRRFPGARRIGDGVRIPLVRGLSVEHLMAHCRAERIGVMGTRVRYQELEDLVDEVTAAEPCGGGGADPR